MHFCWNMVHSSRKSEEANQESSALCEAKPPPSELMQVDVETINEVNHQTLGDVVNANSQPVNQPEKATKASCKKKVGRSDTSFPLLAALSPYTDVQMPQIVFLHLTATHWVTWAANRISADWTHITHSHTHTPHTQPHIRQANLTVWTGRWVEACRQENTWISASDSGVGLTTNHRFLMLPWGSCWIFVSLMKS